MRYRSIPILFSVNTYGGDVDFAMFRKRIADNKRGRQRHYNGLRDNSFPHKNLE